MSNDFPGRQVVKYHLLKGQRLEWAIIICKRPRVPTDLLARKVLSKFDTEEDFSFSSSLLYWAFKIKELKSQVVLSQQVFKMTSGYVYVVRRSLKRKILVLKVLKKSNPWNPKLRYLWYFQKKQKNSCKFQILLWHFYCIIKRRQVAFSWNYVLRLKSHLFSQQNNISIYVFIKHQYSIYILHS